MHACQLQTDENQANLSAENHSPSICDWMGVDQIAGTLVK